MKVGIEGSPFFGNRTGIGQYAKRLITAASQLESDISFEIVRHWLPFKKLSPPISPNKHLSYRLVKWFPPALYFQIFKRLGKFLPYDLVTLHRYDIFIFFNFVLFPLRRRTKGVVVIYDLSFIYFSRYTQHKNLVFMKKFVSRSTKKADHIITISNSSKRQIIDHYNVEPTKISIVSPAVDHNIFYPRIAKEMTAIRKKYRLAPEYVLYTGTLEPRKNVEGVVLAYCQLPADTKRSYGLVLAGGKGWKDESIRRTIEEKQAAGENIVTTGYVPDEDLPAIYSGARVFVYPSFYEGFGMPPLEAMACGVPVICSDNSSLPEVVGDAALLLKAEDIPGITRAISRVLSDHNLAQTLSKKGLAQAKKFTWEKSAKQLLTVLEKI